MSRSDVVGVFGKKDKTVFYCRLCLIKSPPYQLAEVWWCPGNNIISTRRRCLRDSNIAIRFNNIMHTILASKEACFMKKTMRCTGVRDGHCNQCMVLFVAPDACIYYPMEVM